MWNTYHDFVLDNTIGNPRKLNFEGNKGINANMDIIMRFAKLCVWTHTSSEYGWSLCQVLVEMVVGKKRRDSDLFGCAANVCFLAKQSETTHGDQHGLDIDTPQVHEEHHLGMKIVSVKGLVFQLYIILFFLFYSRHQHFSHFFIELPNIFLLNRCRGEKVPLSLPLHTCEIDNLESSQSRIFVYKFA